MCPNAGSSDFQTDLWSSIYGPANLTGQDISNLIPLCAFDTVATTALSPFCGIFTHAEFAQFEYWADLDKYYGTGYVYRCLSWKQTSSHHLCEDTDRLLVQFKV
jgi:hypothetical protein